MVAIVSLVSVAVSHLGELTVFSLPSFIYLRKIHLLSKLLCLSFSFSFYTGF
jgi:hypothetical protein